MRCDGVSPSAPAELAWIVNLLVETARYAEPALDELDRSLLPGIAEMRSSIKSRHADLWSDSLAGCPELVIAADEAGCLADQDLHRFTSWLSTIPKLKSNRRYSLLSEPAPGRRTIRRRLQRLREDVRLRRDYRDLLAEVWEVARPAWERRGRSVAARAASEWAGRLASVTTWPALVKTMPPRHPLTRYEQPIALYRRRRFSVTPVYYCMSGGDVRDLGHSVHVAVPASALDPARRTRDASYVASRMRLLAEPTRVRILIHLMSTTAGIMEITRSLGMSQPTVSEHVRVLARAGLVRPVRRGKRAAYAAAGTRVERVIEDARGTLARWTAQSRGEH